jgi:hypothetical protein
MHVLLQRKTENPKKKKKQQGHYLRNKYLLGPLSFGCCSDHTHSLIRAVSLHYVFSTSCAQSHLIALCPSLISEGALRLSVKFVSRHHTTFPFSFRRCVPKVPNMIF